MRGASMAHCTESNLSCPHGWFDLGWWAFGWLAPLVLVSGCSSTPGMPLAGGSAENAYTNEQPLARPKYAAWIAASAKRCGFGREPDAIKSAYLSFEARQGTSKEELARLEEAYSLALKSANDRIAINPQFCTQKKVAEIKFALQRQDASDYAPNFPKPEVKPVSAPRPSVEEPFDPKKFWEARDAEGAPSAH
jgi:hypothetical protein